MNIKVYIIDDHKILIDSFIDYFKHIEDIKIIGYALSGCEAIEVLNPAENNPMPDVVLQDVGLADINGIECAEVLLKNNPALKIIGFSSYMEPSIVRKMIRKGAKGYVSKATDIAQLEEAIRRVAAGEKFFGEQIEKILTDATAGKRIKKGFGVIPELTEREQEVLEQIAQEKNTKEIADQLYISTNTVETHRKNLILKFDVKNSLGLVRKAIELGIIEVWLFFEFIF